MPGLSIHRRDYEAGLKIDHHAHAETQVTLILAGVVEEWVGNCRRTIEPLDIVVKPAGLVHANRFGTNGAKTIQISFLDDNLGAVTPQSSPLNYVTTFNPALTQRMLELMAYGNNRIDGKQDILRNGLSADFENPPGLRPKRRRPDWLDRMCESLDQSYSQSLTVRDLAHRFQKHPVYVARCFRAHFGMSVKQRIHELRVKRAAKLLAESKLTATRVSSECGFADQSHLNRVFKTHTGLSPVQFRTLVSKKS